MKIPQKWALMLGELHSKVMELQDFFDTIKDELYTNELEKETEVSLTFFNRKEVEEEIESICDRLEDLEADTSALDCEYNDYNSTEEEKPSSKFIITFTSYIRYMGMFGDEEELEFDEESTYFADTQEEAEAIADENKLGLVGQWVEVRINDKLYREYEVEDD